MKELENVKRVLSSDPVLKELIKRFGVSFSELDMDVFNALVRSIVGQQLSTKAASTIYGRFLTLFKGNPSIEELIALPHEELRAVGLSNQKANYVRNVAVYFKEKDLLNFQWDKYGDDELLEMLTEIKGVGRWTVQMLLMFSLGREDIFPVDDLGIQQGMKANYKLKQEGKELKKELIEIADNWKPYRSIASRLIWKAKDSK